MRQCLFCDQRANTREHLLPDWLLEHFRHTKRRVMMAFDLEGRHVRGISITPGMRVKAVCAACNWGWMNMLEIASKPVLGSILHDIATPIDLLQQATIARWALKTSMVMEFIASHVHPFYTRAEREQLRTSSEIPRNTYVWLARYVGEYDLAYVGMHLWNNIPADPNTIHCFVNTIAFGYLAIQVFSAHVPAGHPPANVPSFIAPWQKLLMQVWPTEKHTISWPPELTFSDTGFIALGDLIERFKPAGAVDL